MKLHTRSGKLLLMGINSKACRRWLGGQIDAIITRAELA